MKKIFSIFMIMAIVILLSNSVFCNDWNRGSGRGNWWQQNDPSSEPSESPSESPDVTTSQSLETSEEVTTSPSPTTTEVVQNDTTTSKPIPAEISKKTLPQTGETNNILLIFGIGILCIGSLIGIGFKILGNKNN